MLEQQYKSIWMDQVVYCLTQPYCKNNHVVVIGINKNISARRYTGIKVYEDLTASSTAVSTLRKKPRKP